MSDVASGPGIQTFILVGVLVIALIFADLVWLFVRLSRGKMQPRQEVQTPPEKTAKEKRSRRP